MAMLNNQRVYSLVIGKWWSTNFGVFHWHFGHDTRFQGQLPMVGEFVFPVGPVASCWWIWRISPTVYYPAISIHPIFQYQHLASSSFSQIWNNGGLHVCHVPSTMGTGWIIVNHRDGWKLKPMMHFLDEHQSTCTTNSIIVTTWFNVFF